MANLKLLVTGGAGFIGSNFIRYILNKYPDYKIINLDKLTYSGNLDNLRDIEKNPNYRFVKGDICNLELVTAIISAQKPNVIVNFAAESHVDRSILDAQSFLRTDVWGTYSLLQAVKENKTERMIQISTDEVYGSIENGSFKETDSLNPSSPYAVTKAAADLLCLSFFKTYKAPVLIIRSTNNFGPYQYPEKMIPLFVTNLLENKKLPLYGDGLNIRDWLYVLDNCSAIDLVLHKGKEGEIYNVGGENEATNLDVTRFILKQMAKDESHIEYVADRPGHDRRYALDCQKIKELGWQEEHNFEKALRDTINWYLNNQWWWQKIKTGEYLEYYKRQYSQRENFSP